MSSTYKISQDFLKSELERLPAVADKSGYAAADLLRTLAKAAQGDAALTASVITEGLAVLPTVAAQNGYAASELIRTLAGAAQGDAALTTSVFTAGLAVLPAVAANGGAAAHLVWVLTEAAQGNATLTTAVITAGLAVLPAVADKSGYDAADLVEALVGAARIGTTQGFVCREFMFSAPGGTENRQTIISFGDTPDQTIARTVFFDGTLPQLRSAVEKAHPENSPHRPHYEAVLATAFEALAHRKTLPSFAQSPVRPAVPANP